MSHPSTTIAPEAQAALKAVMEVLDVSGQDEAEPPEVRGVWCRVKMLVLFLGGGGGEWGLRRRRQAAPL